MDKESVSRFFYKIIKNWVVKSDQYQNAGTLY